MWHAGCLAQPMALMDSEEARQQGTPEPLPARVVGVGASAGGLEALEHFFANVPADRVLVVE